MSDMRELRDWINAECEKRFLSWRQASIRAGINPGAISNIMNGERPGLEVCKALAQSFGTSPEYVLQLAGHLPPPPKRTIPAEQQARIDHIIKVWREVAELDPASLATLLNIVEGQAEMAKALLATGRRLEQEENHHTPKNG